MERIPLVPPPPPRFQVFGSALGMFECASPKCHPLFVARALTTYGVGHGIKYKNCEVNVEARRWIELRMRIPEACSHVLALRKCLWHDLKQNGNATCASLVICKCNATRCNHKWVPGGGGGIMHFFQELGRYFLVFGCELLVAMCTWHPKNTLALVPGLGGVLHGG